MSLFNDAQENWDYWTGDARMLYHFYKSGKNHACPHLKLQSDHCKVSFRKSMRSRKQQYFLDEDKRTSTTPINYEGKH
jgi:hypothetical protein